MSVLRRKLRRELWQLKGQLAAIALLVALGGAVFAGAGSTERSLQRAQRDCYTAARFAHVFASLAAALRRVVAELEELDGVQAVDARLSTLASLEAQVELPTQDAVRVASQQHAKVTGYGLKLPLSATVRRDEPAAFTKVSPLGVEEQRVNVLLAPQGARRAWSGLGDGYHVEATIVVETHPDSLLVPRAALLRTSGGRAVFSVEDGKAKRVPVRVAHEGEREVAVDSGPSEGARVSVYPSDEVADGSRVATEP